jgi:hypothetical protein
VNLYRVGVDAIHLESVILKLRNEGDISVETSELVISSSKDSVKEHSFVTIEPGKEKEASFKFISAKLSKEIGVEQIEVVMNLFGYPQDKALRRTEQVALVEKKIPIPIPKVGVGDTIPEIKEYPDRHNLSLTLLWWKESNLAVDGPYSESTYYTFTAKPGMKFVILAYRFQNNWIRKQEIPYLSAGEIATNKGYIYTIWDPPGGIHSTEYKPRQATSEEVSSLAGTSGAYKSSLLPSESANNFVVFEIPIDTAPIEASLIHVPALIRYK